LGHCGWVSARLSKLIGQSAFIPAEQPPKISGRFAGGWKKSVSLNRIGIVAQNFLNCGNLRCSFFGAIARGFFRRQLMESAPPASSIATENSTEN
jgi:hypothetical protein